MQRPESVQENQTQNILRDFKIQADSQIPARGPYIIISKNKERERERERERSCRIVNFGISGDHRVKIK